MSAETSPNDPSITPPANGVPASGQPAVPPAPGAGLGAVAAAAAAAPVVLPPENRIRGLLLSLIAVPVGVVLFVIIWNLGYVASIVGFVIAFGAFFLYKKGSGGRISIPGALIVAAVTLGTLAIAFIIAETSDLASVGVTWAEASRIPGFAGALLADVGMTALFGLIGSGAVVFTAIKESRAQAAAAAPPTAYPPVP
jgi:hypothetical protein